jgi:hypothetical protein
MKALGALYLVLRTPDSPRRSEERLKACSIDLLEAEHYRK